jgi:hypothetical protein
MDLRRQRSNSGSTIRWSRPSRTPETEGFVKSRFRSCVRSGARLVRLAVLRGASFV